MCTVTYLPQQEGQFLLTSNRDEAPYRSPEQISTAQLDGQQLIFPRDEAAGGTWMAASDLGKVVCMLNGAFEMHERRPPYRRSRGLMALDYFEYPDAQSFIQNYTFEGMEAFTMLVFEQGKVLDLRWGQKQLYPRYFAPNQPHIWSSTPLYAAPIRRKREIWFEEWLEKQQGYERAEILHWHRTAGEGDPWTDVQMNRADIVRTVSITSIARQQDAIDMQYHDLLRDQVKTAKIPLKGE